MNHFHLTTVIAASILITGCGTFLNISETEQTNKSPNALVINRPAEYSVTLTIPETSIFFKGKDEAPNNIEPPGPISGVDHDRVITLNVKRMPFATGKLSVELNGAQLMKKVELTSQTGADRAANAAKSGFDARNEIITNRKAAKKAAAGSSN